MQIEDSEFSELLAEASHENYMRAILDMLDDPDIEPPILVFPQDNGCEVIAPNGLEYAQLVGYLSIATLQVKLEWLEAGYED